MIKKIHKHRATFHPQSKHTYMHICVQGDFSFSCLPKIRTKTHKDKGLPSPFLDTAFSL